jgi:hypothetical protein
MLIQEALLAAVQEQPLDVFTITLSTPLSELKDLLTGDIE